MWQSGSVEAATSGIKHLGLGSSKVFISCLKFSHARISDAANWFFLCVCFLHFLRIYLKNLF